MIETALGVIPLAIVASTPLLLAVFGELVVQRSGMINLGVEAMLLTAALTATVAAKVSGSVTIGVIAGIGGAFLIAMTFGALTIRFRADQIVTGTAVNLLALGATGFAFRELRQEAWFGDGVPALTSDWITPVAWIVVPLLLASLLWRTRFGLRLRACGENPEAAAAAGASVARHRWAALALESVLVGIGGAHLAIGLSSGFAENMSAGRGFIALAIVIFGRWGIGGALAGTALFSIAAALQYAMQARGSQLSFHLMLAVPYVVTLLILAGIAGRVRAPEALGRR